MGAEEAELSIGSPFQILMELKSLTQKMHRAQREDPQLIGLPPAP